jgi:hypothetical protein
MFGTLVATAMTNDIRSMRLQDMGTGTGSIGNAADNPECFLLYRTACLRLIAFCRSSINCINSDQDKYGDVARMFGVRVWE